MSTLTGIQDQPVIANDQQDRLGMNAYSKALTKFIGTCPTPMTVAVQGDWGSGKSSLMLGVLDILEKDFPGATPFWINTWQLAQFNSGDLLPLIFLEAIVKQMRKQSDKAGKNLGEKFDDVFRTLKNVGSKVAGVAAKTYGIDGVSEAARTKSDPVAELELLTETFKSLIERVGEGKPNSPAVFFVDDLDRLQPERAVELLEVMKNFLDVPGAVFVLAIDYEVVIKGLRARFGNEDIDGKDGGEKGRSFFDKIIQVPFQMPVHAFKFDRFVEDMAKRTGFSPKAGSNFARFAKAIDMDNPRSIKRAFNTCLLHRHVLELEQTGGVAISMDVRAESLAFAFVCLQDKNKALFDKLIAAEDDSLKAILDEHGDVGAVLRDFIEVRGGALDPHGVQVFRRIVKNAELTAAGPKKKVEGTRNKQVVTFLNNLDVFAKDVGDWFVQTAQDAGHEADRQAGKQALAVSPWKSLLEFGDKKIVLWFPKSEAHSEAVAGLAGADKYLIHTGRNYKVEIAADGDLDAYEFARRFLQAMIV